MFPKIMLICCLFYVACGEQPAQYIKPTNILGSSDQHSFYSSIRPGFTHTAFAFSGPSSHQSFSANIANPYLGQKLLPGLAHPLAYRNIGLGYFPNGPIVNGYATGPATPAFTSTPLPYQASPEQIMALAYLQQLQHHHPQYQNYVPTAYQAQLGQVLALRPAQAQAQVQAQAQTQVQTHQQRLVNSANKLRR